MKRKIYLTPNYRRVLIALESGICASSNDDASGKDDGDDGGTTVDPWTPGGGGDVEFD